MDKVRLLGFLCVAASLCAATDSVLAQNKTRTKTPVVKTQTSVKTAKVSDSDVSGGLKQALTSGVTKAVQELGKEDGFLSNAQVKIPLPKQLQPIEKAMRVTGQGKLADEFVETMNHAAEKAVGEALPIFANSIKQMTFQDARNILTSGETDAATQFFRRTSETQLREKFLPVIKKFTEETGVTAQFKQLTAKAGFLAQLGGKNKLDIDEYVTGKAMDGLFLLIAEEEKNIRKNPLGRTTDLLQKVFGIGKK